MPTSNLKSILIGLLGSIGLASSMQANAIIEAHLNNGASIITTLTSPDSIPTSLQEAIDEDFYFIFDSFYLAKDSVWQGERVTLNRSFVNLNCRLQLGGYFWVTPEDPGDPKEIPQTLWVAVTHGITTKPTPFLPNNDAACSNVRLEFNNGHIRAGFPAESAGAWVGAIDQPNLRQADDTIPVAAVVHNVQVHDGILGYCTSGGTGANGRGGTIAVGFNNNGPTVPASFDFAANISGGGFLPCGVNGELYSVIKESITMPAPPPGLPAGTPAANTPGTPNPSAPSTNKIDAVVRNP